MARRTFFCIIFLVHLSFKNVLRIMAEVTKGLRFGNEQIAVGRAVGIMACPTVPCRERSMYQALFDIELVAVYA